MTNKDFIKLLLIAVGCDKKYEIETYRADDGSIAYDVYGEDTNTNKCISFHGFGMYDVILEFLRYIETHKEEKLLDNLNYPVNHLAQKYLLNDDDRNMFYDLKRKDQQSIEKYLEETKYISDWCKENHPCPNCKINKKDHWDDIHYNCEENHSMRCPILKEFNNKVTELYNEYKEKKKND